MSSLSKENPDRRLQASAAEGLSAEEGFLWSRIDQPMPLGDVLKVSPFDQAKTYQLLESLISKDSVTWIEEPNPETNRSNALIEQFKEQLEQDKGSEAESMDPQLRALILSKLENIEDKNPFEILDLNYSASDHEIKNSYLDLSRQFHPDRFFRKPLGTYKKKLERLFTYIQNSYAKVKNEHDREAIIRQAKSTQKKTQPTAPTSPSKKRAKLDPMMERIGKAEHHFKLGKELEKKKQFSLAGTQYELAAKLNPERESYRKAYGSIRDLVMRDEANRNIERAQELLDEKKNSEAEDLARKALKSSPDSIQAKWIIGRCLADKNSTVSLQEAKELLRRVKASMSKDARPCIWLAKTFIKLKDPDKAREELNEALRRDPENAPAKNLLKKL